MLISVSCFSTLGHSKLLLLHFTLLHFFYCFFPYLLLSFFLHLNSVYFYSLTTPHSIHFQYFSCALGHQSLSFPISIPFFLHSLIFYP